MKENRDYKKTIAFTGERFLPDNSEAKGEIELEHYHRYLMAKSLARGKKVLDIASGEGYGSYLLSEVASSVTGVDLSEEAIENARNNYQRTGLVYVQGSAANIPIEDASIDVVVSFETIEHHDLHEEMMAEICRVLKKNGFLIISSPDKKEYSDIPNYDNPYHVKELYLSEFDELLKKYFSNIVLLGQRVKYGSIIAPIEKSEVIFESFKKTGSHYKVTRGISEPLYFIAIAGNETMPNIPAGIYEDRIENANYIRGVEKIYQDNIIATHEANKEEIGTLHQALSKRDGQIANLHQALSERDGQIATLHQAVSERHDQLIRLHNTISWKLTKPLRAIRYLQQKTGHTLKYFSRNDNSQWLWRNAPLSTAARHGFKNVFFKNFPFLFRRSQDYIKWQDNQKVNRSGIPETTIKSRLNRNEHFVPLVCSLPPESVPVKLIAFYLPQFHAIPENDEWWGEGFTEWTNVKPAKPLFKDHYQPRIPGELGYYDLRNPEVQNRQVELAELYGLGGFCFYFYWFSGKRLLEAPVLQYLENNNLDFPFCLCWANENWSRRWDGLDSDILIGQQHSPEDDIAFIKYISKYLLDDRYIRIDDKPLVLVYRPNLLPSAETTAIRWRQWCREHEIGEIYLAYTQSFETADPTKYGFDAAIEFPPNNTVPRAFSGELEFVDADFSGLVYDWSTLAERSRSYKKPDYNLFRGVCPSWDNTARRKNGANVFVNNSTEGYMEWLRNAVLDTCHRFERDDERLVFLNAWNEWAEGAYLEPDQRNGYAWLDATRKALTNEYSPEKKQRVVVVSHDANPHGAQFLALGLVRALKLDFHFEVEVVLLDTGRLKKDFSSLAPVHDLGVENVNAENLASSLAKRGFKHAIVNTTVSGTFGALLANADITCITLVHELPGVIKSHQLENNTQEIAKTCHHVVFPSEIVRRGFAKFTNIPKEHIHIRPQGLWRRNMWRYKRDEARSEVRSRLGFAQNTPIMLAVGFADRRKGVDLFVQAGLEILSCLPEARFVWIGHWDTEFKKEVDQLIADANAEEVFRFLGYEPETAIFHAGADVYALTSREDPFPNVVLESFDAGIPVVAFQGSGGGSRLVSQIGGRVSPADDITGFAKEGLTFLRNPAIASDIGREAMDHVDRHYAFKHYIFDLCDLFGIKIPRISVIVPNYNYARYIADRLNSIVRQTVPLFELIILDDASTDNSVNTIIKWLTSNKIEAQLEKNDTNSGNVFEQWMKGVSLATGEYVWIAEADDLCSGDLLEFLLQPFTDPEVVLSYCDSQQIDEQGNKLAEDYQHYHGDICAERWRKPYVNKGVDEIMSALAIKNTIPNVSGVLFRRKELVDVLKHNLEQINSFSRAGDWLVYIKLLSKGKIAFNPTACNIHRRHNQSVINGSAKEDLVREIESVQEIIAGKFPLEAGVIAKASRFVNQLRG